MATLRTVKAPVLRGACRNAVGLPTTLYERQSIAAFGNQLERQERAAAGGGKSGTRKQPVIAHSAIPSSWTMWIRHNVNSRCCCGFLQFFRANTRIRKPPDALNSNPSTRHTRAKHTRHSQDCALASLKMVWGVYVSVGEYSVLLYSINP